MKLPRRVRADGKPGNLPPSERQKAIMLSGFQDGLSDAAISDLVSEHLEPGEFARNEATVRKWRFRIDPPAELLRIRTGVAAPPLAEFNRLFVGACFEDDPRAVRSIGVTRFPRPPAVVLSGSSIALCSEIG